MSQIVTKLDPSSGENPTYYPGQLLKGSVELQLNRQLKIRGLSVTVYGRALTYWTDNKFRRTLLEDGTYEDQYTGLEIYVDSKKYILGQEYGAYFDMAAGVHRYNFSFQIPEHSPNSVEASYGDISYFIETKLEALNQPDQDHDIEFTVKRNDDIMLIPELLVPYETDYICTFCCLFCKSMPIFMTVTVPRTGFNRGEKIPIKVDYVNKSHRKVFRTVIKLKQCHTFYCDTPKVKTKEEFKTIVESKVGGVEKFSTGTIEEYLEIPIDLDNSNKEFTRYVKIAYFILVWMELKKPNLSHNLFVPITIGSAPVNINIKHPLPFNPIPSASAPSAPPPMLVDAMSTREAENSALLGETSSEVGWNY